MLSVISELNGTWNFFALMERYGSAQWETSTESERFWDESLSEDGTCVSSVSCNEMEKERDSE